MTRGGPRLIPLATHTPPGQRPPRRFTLPLTVIAVLSAVTIVAYFLSRGGSKGGGSGDRGSGGGGGDAAAAAAAAGSPLGATGGQPPPPTTTVIGASAATPTTRVYFDITHNTTALGRLTLGLFDERAPRTVANFVALATGKGGPPPSPAGGGGGEAAAAVAPVPGSAGTAGYEGVAFHRVIRGFMAQGGDYERGDGRGGKGIYPGGKFDDEPFVTTHDGRGTLSMANSGPNTNGAQFFITFKATSWLDGKHVVFGRVLDGHPVLDAMERVDTGRGSRPTTPLVITSCGVVED